MVRAGKTVLGTTRLEMMRRIAKASVSTAMSRKAPAPSVLARGQKLTLRKLTPKHLGWLWTRRRRLMSPTI